VPDIDPRLAGKKCADIPQLAAMSSAGWVFAHYPYIEDLIDASPDDLLRLENVGVKGVVNTQIGLTCVGLSLKGFEWQVVIRDEDEDPWVKIDPACISEAMCVKYKLELQYCAPSSVIDLIRTQEASRRELEGEVGREDWE
jgi:hypothetical protein